MRRALVGLTLLGSFLIGAATADAAQQTVFDGAGADGTGALTCTVQSAGPVAGQRWCGNPTTVNGQQQAPSTVASFDGTPIDVTVVLPPAPAEGADGDFPIMGVFHGYGGQKYNPQDPIYVQRWVSRGYAVMTPTTRGFWGSCGVKVPNPKPPACANGYIHLLANGVEVRDMQHLFGLLADEGVISNTRIGVVGQSYGGGMAMQLGALKNRVSDEAGNLSPWKSPLTNKDMSIAAAAPEFGWSNLAYGLIPNGSFLDYAAFNPYRGPDGDRRAGSPKLGWMERLYGGGQQTGFYSNTDERYDIPDIRQALLTGGPYDDNTEVQTAIDQLSANHSAYGIDDSQAPAPMLLAQGWNDDLFPVSEALRFYNKTREKFPNAPLNLFAFDYGHTPRAAINTDNVTSLFATQGLWMDHYVRNAASEPEDPAGGVNLIASGCASNASNAAATSGAAVHADTWADVADGEITMTGADATIPAATQTAEGFQSFGPNPPPTTICTTSGTANTPGAAVAVLEQQSSDFTLAGAATVIADITSSNANDHVVARLYDVNTAEDTQRLIARTVYRPVGTGERQTVFQLSPQLWKVVQGHQLKLELLTTDQPYVLNQTGQGPVQVKNLRLRVPTLEAPGAAGGTVKAAAERILPPGYKLARDFVPAATPSPSPTATPTYVIPTPTPTPHAQKAKPNITAKAKPRRDRKKPFIFRVQGKLKFPATVSKAAGCKGTVRVVAKKGKKVIAKRRTGVKSTCKYKARVKLRKNAGKRGKVKFQVRFLGNDRLFGAKARTSARYGR